MKQLLSKLDASAAASVARAEFSPREVLLLSGVAAFFSGFFTFAVMSARSDPQADRSLVYFLFGFLGVFWLVTAASWIWAARWWAHWRSENASGRSGVELARTVLVSTSWEIAAGDELPLEWSRRAHLGWRDLLAFGSFMLVEAVLMLGASSVVLGAGFHLDPAQRLSFPRDFPIVACLIAGFLVAGLTGKYLWLWVTARWLSRSEIAPILAYGFPRRLSRFDQRLLERITRK